MKCVSCAEKVFAVFQDGRCSACQSKPKLIVERSLFPIEILLAALVRRAQLRQHRVNAFFIKLITAGHRQRKMAIAKANRLILPRNRRRSAKRLRIAATALILLFVSGCSSVPQKSIKTLPRAPQEARTVSQTEAVTVNVPVKLQWNPNPSEDHAKYEVYEVNPSFGTTKAYWKKLATVDSPNYVANWPSRSLHVCAVKAVNPFQSPFSVPVIVQVP